VVPLALVEDWGRDVNEHVQAQDIGDRLKEARVARGLSLADIAERTKISPPSLTAMERNQFARLPGGVFRRAYVRAFAVEVGLDVNALVRDYRDRYEPEEVPVAPPPPRPAWGRRGAVALAAVGVLVVMWLLLGPAPRDGEPRAGGAAGAADTVAAAPAPVVTADSGAQSDVVFADGDDAGAPLRLRLQVSSPSWISVYADGQRVVHRLVEAGEHLRVEATRAITLHAGDAGAVDYALNGEEARVLGGTGQVRTVRFTGDGRRPVRTRSVEPPGDTGVSSVG
jgi:cytoskeleton protein RodZ